MIAIGTVLAVWMAAVPPPAAANDIEPSRFFPLQVRWTVDLDRPPAAPPAVTEQAAFVPMRDGTVVAILLEDGSTTWTVEHPTRLAPAATDHLVIVGGTDALVGLRAADGAVAWERPLAAPLAVAPRVSGGWLFVGLENGDLVTLRAEDGVELWRHPLARRLSAPPSPASSELFVPVEDGRLLSFDLTTGARHWERVLGGAAAEVLPLDDLFVGSADNFMYRLSRRHGAIQWRWRTGADIVGRPSVDTRRVFFVSFDNMLRALDRESGVQQWRRPLAGRPTAGPILVEDLVLVAGVAPQIRAFDAESGAPMGVLTAPAELAAPPHVFQAPSALAPGVVLLTGDGQLALLLRAFGLPTFDLLFPPEPLLPGPARLAPAEVLPFRPYHPADLPPSEVLPFIWLDDVELIAHADRDPVVLPPDDDAAGADAATPGADDSDDDPPDG